MNDMRHAAEREQAAMKAATRKRDLFEKTWAAYVDALDRLDTARASDRGHAPRVRRGWRRESLRLEAILVNRFEMVL